MKTKSVSSQVAWLFKPWIVKRPDGGCQVLFPLTELDKLVEGIIKIIKEANVTEEQWKAAITHLDQMDKAYLHLTGQPQVNVEFVRRVIIAPLRDRYDNGVRTQELYDAIMAIE